MQRPLVLHLDNLILPLRLYLQFTCIMLRKPREIWCFRNIFLDMIVTICYNLITIYAGGTLHG